MRSRSQVTIPKEIVDELKLKSGDRFEVFVKDGMICFMPVAVYPKVYVDTLKSIAAETVSQYNAGNESGINDIDALINDLNMVK
jgi:AbrB family looped-hinge helix DNA binding protein